MLHKSFGEFIDKKKRDATRQLEVVEKVLRKGGLKVESFLEADSKDPYIFCFNPSKNGSFEGIRLYKIGNTIAFRIQKESKTHPYGKAYPLNIEEMFNDLLSDEDVDEKTAGKKVMEAVAKEVRKFFERSAEAEKDSKQSEINDKDVSLRGQGADYSSLVYNKGS